MKTVKDIYNEMTYQEKRVVKFIINAALEESWEDQARRMQCDLDDRIRRALLAHVPSLDAKP